MSKSRSTDIRMPLLAFVALMLESGCELSDEHWEQVKQLGGGVAADSEIARAIHWLTDQGKTRTIGPMLRHMCMSREDVCLDTGRWAQLIALPVVGFPADLVRLAAAFCGADMTPLTQTGRLPADANLHWLPFTYAGDVVDGWLTTPRTLLLDLVLNWHNASPHDFKEQLARMGNMLSPADASGSQREVRLLLGVITSEHPTWLEGPHTSPATAIVQVGQDFETLLEDVSNHLKQRGLNPDVDELFETTFREQHNLSIDEAIDERVQALDRERHAFDTVLLQAQVANVEVYHLQNWSLALMDRAILAIRLAVGTERAAQGLATQGDYQLAHVAPDENNDTAWALAEDTQGHLWGPYRVDGITLYDGILARLVDEAFSRNPMDDGVEVIAHLSPHEFPQTDHLKH